MAKKAVKKVTKHSSPKARVVKKTTTVESQKKVVRKTTEAKKKPAKSSSDKKKATPKQGKGNVKIESSSKSVSESSDLDKLDTIIYSKSRKESQASGSAVIDGKSGGKKGKPLKKEAKVEVDPTGSGDSRSKSPKNQSQESFLKKSAKQQVSGKVDTQSISDEISRIIKRLEVKKVQQTSKSPTEKKGSSRHKQKVTAKSVNFTLQKNPKMKFTPIIDLFELAKKPEYLNTDIILGIIEIAYHTECYILPNSPKSNSFWDEIVQFNEFKRLFQFLRSETLKKYWRLLSYKECTQHAIRIVQHYKKLIDEKKPRLLTIITGIQNFACKKLKDFEDFILNPHKYLNLGIPSEIETKLNGKRRGREIEKKFKGDNYTPEIKNFLAAQVNQQPVLLLEEKDEVKRLTHGLRIINSRDNRKLFKFTEEDKFVFSCIDNVLEGICKEVKEATKDLVINALKINTLNIPQTYEYLKKPHLPLNEKTTFNLGDDHVIKYMKDSAFYKELVENKGKDNVENREFFLS